MITKNEIIEVIFTSIGEINEQNDTTLVKDVNTKFIGRDCDLDSLGLVNLIVSIEENLNNEFNTTVTIADEKAMSQKHSPFRTVDTLADYILQLVTEK